MGKKKESAKRKAVVKAVAGERGAAKPGVKSALVKSVKKATATARPSKKIAGNSVPVDTGETVAQRRDRAGKIVKKLEQTYGPVTCALHHETALQLLVSTILSAQSTDETVNRVTPGLWKKYPSAAAFAEAPIEELENDIRSTGFFHQKAKNIKAACRLIVEQFGGDVPGNMADLVTLPGVARKTANVVLGTWFERNDGVVVDTHVGRLAQRLGLTWTSKNDKDAVKIENDLMEIVPQPSWTYLSHALIAHGRKICTARKPKCPECPLNELCPSAGLV